MTLLATTLILSAACVSRADQDSRTAAANTQAPARRVPVREHCAAAVKAITYYRRAYIRSRTAMSLKGAVPRVWYQQCPALRERAVAWRGRARKAARELAAWKREYAWWLWLPANWQQVGACETGYGRRPGNWSHDSGSHVSAFGITRHNYMVDAHRIGNLSWDETKTRLGRLPTPREQYDAALSHYATYGDGWTCPGP